MKSNVKTTIFGIIAAIGQGLAHYGPAGLVQEIGTIVSLVATTLLGASAADSGSTKS